MFIFCLLFQALFMFSSMSEHVCLQLHKHISTHQHPHVCAYICTHRDTCIHTHKYVFLATWSHTMYISWRLFLISAYTALLLFWGKHIFHGMDVQYILRSFPIPLINRKLISHFCQPSCKSRQNVFENPIVAIIHLICKTLNLCSRKANFLPC